MTRPRATDPIFPLTPAEWVVCTFATALSIYVIGMVMGVQWF